MAFAEEKRQIQKLKALRLERDNGKVQRSLKAVKEAAPDGVNLVDPILEAVYAYAPIGEICGVLEEVWGRYKEGGI